MKQLEQFPYFTSNMLKAYLGINHPEVTLSRWKNKIIRIEKGKYTVHENPLIYATIVQVPSYCSFLSALSYYQLTTQIPIRVQIVTNKKKHNTKLIEFIQSQHMFGYKKELINTFDFFIAEKEKLLLDCLHYQNQGISPSELTQLIQEPLDTEKLITYLKKMNNLALIKRTGYLLELRGISLYNEFQNQIKASQNYPLLNSKLPKTKKINKKWRLCVNEKIQL